MTAPLYMTENVGIFKRFLRIQRRVSYAHSSRDQRLAEVRYSASHMIHCYSPLIQMILNITNFQPQIKSYATEMRGSVFYIDILEIEIFWSLFNNDWTGGSQTEKQICTFLKDFKDLTVVWYTKSY